MKNNELTIEELKSVSGGWQHLTGMNAFMDSHEIALGLKVSRMKLGVWSDGNTVNTAGFTPTTDLPDGDYYY